MLNDKDIALQAAIPIPEIPPRLVDSAKLLPLMPKAVYIGPDLSSKLNVQEQTLPASPSSDVAAAQPKINKLFDATVLNALKQLPSYAGLTSPLGPYDLGGGYDLNFDKDTLAGHISPALMPEMMGALEQLGEEHFFTGSDCRIMIDCDYLDENAAAQSMRKQLVEATTLSVSIHRVKTPARAFGYINPKGVARGTRTCAGTLVCTQGVVEVLFRFLAAMKNDLSKRADVSKDSFYHKVDQLPPFNLTLFFSDEFGHASFQRILGVEMVTDGVIRSINDMITEQTITWIAADVTPLLPLSVSSLAKASLDRRSKAEKSVADAINQRAERLRGKSELDKTMKARGFDRLPYPKMQAVKNALGSHPDVEVSPIPDQLIEG